MIADTLFPIHPRIDWESIPRTNRVQGQELERNITMDELQLARRKLTREKAPGPDCIPNEVLAVVVKRKPGVLLETFNACIRQRLFPER